MQYVRAAATWNKMSNNYDISLESMQYCSAEEGEDDAMTVILCLPEKMTARKYHINPKIFTYDFTFMYKDDTNDWSKIKELTKSIMKYLPMEVKSMNIEYNCIYFVPKFSKMTGVSIVAKLKKVNLEI